jgi:tetratricopeptide (TPR) repeat protein
MKFSKAIVLITVFAAGLTVGAVAKKGVDPALYHSKAKEQAGKALLELAKSQAGKGSWENIGVGRVYYLAGMKSEGQAIFDKVTSKKPEPSDWFRIGRVYWEANEWDKAREAFDKALQASPKDAPWLAEIGGYYNLKGDRATAEQMFDKSYDIESGEVWATLNMAGSYLGIRPQQY